MKPVALAVALAVAMAALLVVPSAEAATTSRTLTISNSSARPQVPFGGFDGNPPKLFDMDGDGDMEIIAQNDNHWVYVFDSRTGAILAEVKSTVPSGWGARTFNGPEVAVFDSAGTVRLIIQSSAAVVGSYRVDLEGSTSGHIKLVKEWERRLNDCHSGAGADSKPVLADLDKDGKYEIVVATEELGLYALRSDGTLYWKNCIGGGNAEPTVADINQDGWPDVVFGSDGGVVSAHNGRTGGWMWGYNVLSHFPLHSGSMPVGVAIGQLDGKLGPDIVVGARDSHDANDFSKNHAMLLALDSGGRLLWARQDPNGNPLTYTHPIIADAAGDGQNEVYWADWNTMGHKPGNWEVTGPAHFYRYDAAGNLVWRQSLDSYWNNKDLAIADVDGDGVQEVLANGPGPGGDGIWYLDTRTGAKETFVGTTSWKVARAPVVADLWGTGTMQWIVQVGPADATNSGGGVLVYDTHAPYSSVYPHLPYPSLSSAQPPPPPPPPPPTGATFDASFKLTNPNEWWQQVDVTPTSPRTVADVDIRANGGAWQQMSKNQWGAWTSSIRAPAGTQVEFLATDPGGAVAQSAPFTWLDGTMTKGSVTPGSQPPPPPPPPPSTGGAFDASFKLTNPNEWWQQVDVTPTPARTVTKVDIRANGGAWQPMAKNQWGAWTSSIRTPAGTQVEFLATDPGGAVAQSAAFTWLDGTATKGSATPGTTPPPAPPPQTFNPTFTPTSNRNPWWVEVQVTGGTIAKVEASTAGGAWIDLPATSWGTWAKSYHVPPGSLVQFRATNDAGAVATSASHRWG